MRKVKQMYMKVFRSNDIWKYYYMNSPLVATIDANENRLAACNLYMARLKCNLIKKYKQFPEDIKVSIVMPVYNRANIISQAIESVMKQSYTNWELIIIDDNSNDNVAEVVNSFNNNKIIFVANSHKKGVCGARNTGLELATGDYIAYLDSDNDWDKDYLLLMVNTYHFQ